ncbi:MAG: sulfotransferase family protein [Acidimicrobiia bacterium]|nr:sulfotransferase family protein [Acidimicrobiia bacterium]
MDEMKRICLWSGPRNVSTALMYSFRERSDTTVVDEPLYGHYLATTGVAHPGDDEVLAAMENDGERVVESVIMGAYPTPIVFFKNMAHHLVGLDRSFLNQVVNVILTREPEAMLSSLIQQLPNPAIEETGLPNQVKLVDSVLAAGREPIVLESRALLTDPPTILFRLCDRIGIPYTDEMLSWEPGPKPEDGNWAPYWYDTVHRSTGFAPYRPKDDKFPSRLAPLLEEAQELYLRVAAHRL